MHSNRAVCFYEFLLTHHEYIHLWGKKEGTNSQYVKQWTFDSDLKKIYIGIVPKPILQLFLNRLCKGCDMKMYPIKMKKD